MTPPSPNTEPAIKSRLLGLALLFAGVCVFFFLASMVV